MWLIKKKIKVKLEPELLGPDGKPLYDLRHPGEPCPEASGWPNPELWCIYVSDDSPECKRAYDKYKHRTGHEFKDGYQENSKPEESGPDRDQVISDLAAAIKNGAKVDYNKDQTTEELLIMLSQAEQQIKDKKDVEETDPDPKPIQETSSGDTATKTKDKGGSPTFGFHE